MDAVGTEAERQAFVAGDQQKQAAPATKPRQRPSEFEPPRPAGVPQNDGAAARQPGGGGQRIGEARPVGHQNELRQSAASASLYAPGLLR
jgi:hypothetical protein